VVQRCVLAIFAAAVGWMLPTVSAPAAYASCGDWLQHNDQSAPVGSDNKAIARDEIAPKSPGIPCNGPNCSRVPDQPAAPAPANISFAPAKSALEIGSVTLAECACQTDIAGQSSAKRAKGFRPSVYHPPRV